MGFSVLAIFWIGFSVFVAKDFRIFRFLASDFREKYLYLSGFSVLVPDVVFGFWKGREFQ